MPIEFSRHTNSIHLSIRFLFHAIDYNRLQCLAIKYFYTRICFPVARSFWILWAVRVIFLKMLITANISISYFSMKKCRNGIFFFFDNVTKIEGSISKFLIRWIFFEKNEKSQHFQFVNGVSKFLIGDSRFEEQTSNQLHGKRVWLRDRCDFEKCCVQATRARRTG